MTWCWRQKSLEKTVVWAMQWWCSITKEGSGVEVGTYRTMLPNIMNIVRKISNLEYKCKQELKDGYLQVPLHKESQEFTAFVCSICHNEFYENATIFSKPTTKDFSTTPTI